MKKETLTLRGDRALWLRFVARVKEERKTVWVVLEKLLQDYLKKRNE